MTRRDLDDYEDDLVSQSEFAVMDRRPTPQPSKFLRQARASLFEEEDFEMQQSTQQPPQVKKVRGRPIKHYKEEKPGALDNNIKENLRLIRQVSGLGYSNQIIEQTFRKNKIEKSKEVPDIGFILSTQSSSSKNKVTYDELFKDSINIKDDKSFPPLK